VQHKHTHTRRQTTTHARTQGMHSQTDDAKRACPSFSTVMPICQKSSATNASIRRCRSTIKPKSKPRMRRNIEQAQANKRSDPPPPHDAIAMDRKSG
jgi:hypothetical protein